MKFSIKNSIGFLLVLTILTATVFHCCLPSVVWASYEQQDCAYSQEGISAPRSSHECCNPNPISFVSKDNFKNAKALASIFEYAKKVFLLANSVTEYHVPKTVFANDESPPKFLQKSVPIYLFIRVLRL